MSRNNIIEDKLQYTGKSKTPTHLHLCTYDSEGAKDMVTHEVDNILENLCQENKKHWLQIHGLQDTMAIQKVCKHFHIDFLIIQDILNARHLTKIEQHDDYNVIILKLLVMIDNEIATQHIAIVQGADYVLTFLEKETEFFCEVNAAVHKNTQKIRSRGTDFLLSVIMNSVMAHYMTIVSKMEDELEDMEEQLLDWLGNNYSDMSDIQKYRRNYRLIKKTINPIKEQINALFRSDNTLIGEENRPFFNDVNDHLHFVVQTLDSCRDILSALVDLYLSNNDLRMNNIMKQLAIVSTFFIPLTFFAGIWGMNFKYMPELDWKYGYLGAWILMFLICVAVFIYFKRKRWY